MHFSPNKWWIFYGCVAANKSKMIKYSRKRKNFSTIMAETDFMHFSPNKRWISQGLALRKRKQDYLIFWTGVEVCLIFLQCIASENTACLAWIVMCIRHSLPSGRGGAAHSGEVIFVITLHSITFFYISPARRVAKGFKRWQKWKAEKEATSKFYKCFPVLIYRKYNYFPILVVFLLQLSQYRLYFLFWGMEKWKAEKEITSRFCKCFVLLPS